MAQEQHIQQDSTASVVSYPPAAKMGLGKISAITHKLRTPSTDFQSAAEAATYDTVDTTLDAAAVEGALSVSVASATGITADRTYLIGLGASALDVMPVRVARVSGTTVTLEEPLPAAVASGDLFIGWQVSHALLATETDQEGEGLVIWTATIGGETVEWEQQFRIVRQVAAYTLDAYKLTTLMPMCRDLQDPQDPTFQEVIRSAWETYLVPSLLGRAIRPQRIHSWEHLEPWHATAVAYHLLRNQRRTGLDVLEAWRIELARAADDALGSVDFWYDDDGTNEVRDDETTDSRFGAYRKVIS